ncbi:MAG: cobaltochelatase subunit CobN [Acidiphilium sp.]|nr:cobaltochelatase subunit CobN [Acidiphilium sp.]MDD4935585.1 cobaltochelatase subunit CobN [Acidiphilium sp.]
MHLLVRDTATLDDQEPAVDLGQSPADLVFLSFSGSDLGAIATAWQAMATPRPSLRLANLIRLRHPLSVDLYVEQVIAKAKTVVVRLLGGVDYWRYGVEEVAAMCRARRIALIMVEGDGRPDARLAGLSTVTGAQRARMATCLRESGPENIARALALAAHLGGLGPDGIAPPAKLPVAGCHIVARVSAQPLAMIIFYRSHLLSGDIAPIDALAAALRERGLAVEAWFVSSLKEPDAADRIAARLREAKPTIILNATGFSARGNAGSPLDAAGVPVLQVVLSAQSIETWREGFRGVSQTDLAMQVVLPELDGRLLTTAISFKAEAETVPGLEFARIVNRPDPAGIALAADRAAGWARLAATHCSERRIALVVSDYPGALGTVSGQTAHAVGLDSFASISEILRCLDAEGYACGEDRPEAASLAHDLCHAAPAAGLGLAEYRSLFAELPAETQARVIAAWDEPDADPSVQDSTFMVRHIRRGNLILAVQPDRGSRSDRKTGYHDADLPPRHAYVAFYLWLRRSMTIHALIHLGTHGTLEWLPGKAAALSAQCLPVALLRGLPVIYPFIVNNPGEAAAAKRRLGAVAIGHLTPPLIDAGAHGAATELERLIDEYATADGLDRRRSKLLRRQILDRAAEIGLLSECGVAASAADDVALARLDAYLCDLKDLQIRDGLHVFGRPPKGRDALLATLQKSCPGIASDILADRLDGSAGAEMASLLAALNGQFIVPGPAGAPTRGRADVLPTGRNLTTLDPRLLPTDSAVMFARKAAESLLDRHMQDQGDYLRRTVIDLWGSASLRTGGEDFALALVLLGVAPLWDEGSGRVSGFEVIPLALLDRPRVDVTLRISGLFRDAFETQIALFDAAVRAIASRDEAPDWNPLAGTARGLEGEALRAATTRIYGAAPGDYGAAIADRLARGHWHDRAELGTAYLAASANAYGKGLDGSADPAGFAARVATADAFVHQQDHAETDILDSPEYAAHEGGFAAAAAALGADPALYHMDTSRPDAPRNRLVAEEIARVVRGRLANPRWIAGMMRHGYRGASEIARGVASLHGFAATMPARFDAQFDLVFAATLADSTVDAFLCRENPAARAAMAAHFSDAQSRDLWHPHRNDVGTVLDAAP